jgi:hypothetical protein
VVVFDETRRIGNDVHGARANESFDNTLTLDAADDFLGQIGLDIFANFGDFQRDFLG